MIDKFMLCLSFYYQEFCVGDELWLE